MATNIYNFTASFLEYDGYNTGAGSLVFDVFSPLAYPPAGAVGAQYVNVVWDTVEGDYVPWLTYYIDNGGQAYPGPGVFGVDTSDYVVQVIHYDRNQL